MIDSEDFLHSGLWCEYAYIINLDTEMLEFYVGGTNGQEINGRYKDAEKDDMGYGGVHLIGEFPIKTVTVEDYEKALEAYGKGDNLAAVFEIEMED